LADGVGYSRLNVPTPADAMALPIEDPDGCPAIQTEDYKGILLGDVTGNYAEAASSAQFKSAINTKSTVSAEAGITLTVVGNTIEVVAKEGDAIDLQVEVANVVDVYTSLQGATNIVGNVVKLALFDNAAFTDTKVATIKLSESVTADDIDVLASSINEKNTDVDVVVESTNGINDVNFSGVSIYPNPVSDKLHVVTGFEAEIAIYSVNGTEMVSKTEVNGSASFDVSELAKGLYFVKVVKGDQVETFNFVVD
jgi:hypothetical protein